MLKAPLELQLVLLKLNALKKGSNYGDKSAER